jgi:hypothetical protein
MRTDSITVGESLVSTASSEPFFHRVWPPVFIVCGLGVTAVWISFLGYEIINLIIAPGF